MAVGVLHHADDAEALAAEMKRVVRRSRFDPFPLGLIFERDLHFLAMREPASPVATGAGR